MPSKTTQPRKEPFPLCVAIGEVVFELRGARGWSLEELSVRAGVARQTVRHVESGWHTAKVDTLERIAEALGMWCEELIAQARVRCKGAVRKC